MVKSDSRWHWREHTRVLLASWCQLHQMVYIIHPATQVGRGLPTENGVLNGADT